MNVFNQKRLKYLIGTDAVPVMKNDQVLEVSYDTYDRPFGLVIKYCNLFDEKNTGEYGPYLHTSDTADDYNEGQIDPRGEGWEKNLREQFEKAQQAGFRYIELDNPDAYKVNTVVAAIDLANSYELKVIAKNPGLMEQDPTPYVEKSEAIIVEQGAGTPTSMHTLLSGSDKTVWFVSFGSKGEAWAQKIAKEIEAKGYKNMFVTWSPHGEYTSAVDIT